MQRQMQWTCNVVAYRARSWASAWFMRRSLYPAISRKGADEVVMSHDGTVTEALAHSALFTGRRWWLYATHCLLQPESGKSTYNSAATGRDSNVYAAVFCQLSGTAYRSTAAARISRMKISRQGFTYCDEIAIRVSTNE